MSEVFVVSKIIWEKQVGPYKLLEIYKPWSNRNTSACVSCFGKKYYFGSWGMDREAITEAHISQMCIRIRSTEGFATVYSFASFVDYEGLEE